MPLTPPNNNNNFSWSPLYRYSSVTLLRKNEDFMISIRHLKRSDKKLDEYAQRSYVANIVNCLSPAQLTYSEVCFFSLSCAGRMLCFVSVVFQKPYLTIDCSWKLLFKLWQVFAARYFSGHWPNFFKDRKKVSGFGHNVSKYRAMHTVMASFNTTVGQMTEMSQRKNWPSSVL